MSRAGRNPAPDRCLGQWFHNIELKGVRTAPNHFLGDYPNVKWRRFAHAVPKDLRGMTVLDIGCNGGFYSIEMKRRGADRVVAIDTETMYLNQARFAAEMSGVEIEFRDLSVYDVAKLGERFDLVIFMGVLYHLRHPLLALDLIHDHVARDLLLFQSMQRGSADVEPLEPDYSIRRDEDLRPAGLPEAPLRRASLFPRRQQLVDSEPRLRRSHAPRQRFRDPGAGGGGGLSLPPVERAAPGAGAVYPARGQE